MRMNSIGRWAVAATLLLLLNSHRAGAVSYTWDGSADADGDGTTWTDPLNWTADSGFPSTTLDTATFIGAANIAATGLPQTINRLFTGAGLVQLGGGMNFGPNVDPNGPVVGAGGLIVNGNLGGQMRSFSSAGNVTVNGTVTMFAFFPVQTAGTWDFTSLQLPNNSGNIAAWSFVDGANTTITNSFTSATYTFTGSPTFTGGRPNWTFTSGGDGGTILQLGNKTIFGNQLSLGSWPGGGTRHTQLNSNGGTLDINVLNILTDSGGTGNFINVDNGTILIQGTSGLVWNNQSDEITQFDVRNNTTVTFASGATANIDTGSKDNGLFASSFVNNFAFDEIVIPAGSSIQLTGGDYLGASLNALYATNITGGGTLRLNGRNVYLEFEAGNDVLFDFTGGGQVFYLNLIPVPEPSSLALLGLGVLGMAIRARRRKS